jgi:hypothetical protein
VEAAKLTDRLDRGTAERSHALANRVDCHQDLVRLFGEQ